MEVLIFLFEDSDFLVVVVSIDFILLGEYISGPHIDSSFYPPLNIIVVMQSVQKDLLGFC